MSNIYNASATFNKYISSMLVPNIAGGAVPLLNPEFESFEKLKYPSICVVYDTDGENNQQMRMNESRVSLHLHMLTDNNVFRVTKDAIMNYLFGIRNFRRVTFIPLLDYAESKTAPPVIGKLRIEQDGGSGFMNQGTKDPAHKYAILDVVISYKF